MNKWREKLRERKGSLWPRVLGIDEHFFSRSRGRTQFTTVFTNVGRRKMFEMALSKETASLKERLHEFYRTKGYNRAVLSMSRLLEDLKASPYEELQRLRRTLKDWQKEIPEYFRTGFTNAFTEAMNGLAKLVQRRGCDYRSFKNYRLRTLSACPL